MNVIARYSQCLFVILPCVLVVFFSVRISISAPSSIPLTDSSMNLDLPIVEINLDTKHRVGGVERFDRRKFINIHASNIDGEWDEPHNGGGNDFDDLITDFLVGYDVYLGRDTGAVSWWLGALAQDLNRSGFVLESDVVVRGNEVKRQYRAPHDDRARDMVIGGQPHPFWPDGTLTRQGWALSQADTIDEPFGSATGHFIGQYLTRFFSQNKNDIGANKPLYLEVINEPMWHLVDIGKASTPARIFEYHNGVARAVRALSPETKIGGFTVAFPDFENDNFNQWEVRHKKFIDVSGKNMDFISLHLYDWAAIGNSRRYRKGSNVEATFDMLEQYSHMALGEVRPFIISEFGAQVHTHINAPWSAYRDWEKLAAMNALYMSFIERPDRILKTIPFIVVKGEWGRSATPYNDRLMRQKFEAEGETGNEWVYTELVKLYQLWSEVEGTRVDSWSAEPDLVVDSYVDGNEAYMIINSLEFDVTVFDLNALGVSGASINSVNIKHLYYDALANAPVLSNENFSDIPESLVIQGEATMIVKVTYSNDIELAIIHTNTETKYYAQQYKQVISENKVITFNINGVSKGAKGEAVLRLGIARAHGRSLQPTLNVNGYSVAVPEDFRGYDQNLNGRGRDSFYGVIEVIIPYEYIEVNNIITLNFSDTGGFVATATLQNFTMSKALPRGV